MTRSELHGWLEWHLFRLVSQTNEDAARAMLADSASEGVTIRRRVNVGRGVWLVATVAGKRTQAFRTVPTRCAWLVAAVPEVQVSGRAIVEQNMRSMGGTNELQ